ncbi:DUF2232 domain-containing protein [Pleurocapsa sp. CCALA 161]|uniref:DUF2232 domain-containing protein n=1 Tax=Pleurocapsa sp. CCALA 161 TaxID=2107688 RepID=UPI000D04BCAF|nr:DUF2232 domain-containing protein [Pleurocapsa sp. CCALA 161]PSB12869.1 DUF2232 domain-containing protein [Pleurocapsa sp. CCALA 161]
MSKDYKDSLSDVTNQVDEDEINWVDQEDAEVTHTYPVSLPTKASKQTKVTTDTVVMVETAFLASTASLVWLINFYFPVGPVLKIFFPIPIALIYLRRGNRAAWMAAIVSSLLLLVLMGPIRSLFFLMPYGLMGVALGTCWQRRLSWLVSIVSGAVIGSLGLFFRFWLNSILIGENLWVYVITNITKLLDWGFFQLGILAQPNFALIQTLAIGSVIVQNLVYLFAVHLVALMLLDRLDNPIPPPPEWVRVLLDY